jgi:NAD(P)-dependent dehydrogenase (short-subunit alcohol dehydrogenase family)
MHHDHELEGKGVRAAAFKADQGDATHVDGLVKAVDAITRSLSKELDPRKNRVNSINPGMVATEGARAGGFLDVVGLSPRVWQCSLEGPETPSGRTLSASDANGGLASHPLTAHRYDVV